MAPMMELLGQFLVRILKKASITDVEKKEYRATEVRQGLLQDDPVEGRIVILIHPDNPNSKESRPTWAEKPASHVYAGFDIATYEIGGGQRMWKRFTIEFSVSLVDTGENRDQARETAYWVIANANHALIKNKAPRTVEGGVIRDEFGETAILMLTETSNAFEGGGPDNTFIWKAETYVQILTEVE